MPKPLEDIDTGAVDPARLIDTARSRGLFVFDLETTGLAPRHDRIEGIAFYVPEDEVTGASALRAWYPFADDTFRTWVQPDETVEEQRLRLRYERLRDLPSDSDSILDSRAEWMKVKQKPVVKNLRPAMNQRETMNALRPLFEESPGTIAVAHNCLQYNTKVLLADGTTERIGVIVNKRLPVSVMSWDGERFVAKRVTNWWRNGGRDNWHKLVLSHKPRGACLYVTGDHEVYISHKEKRRVDELKPGDALLRAELRLTSAQEQLVVGTGLGDGSFSLTNASVSHHLSVGHAPRQERYLDWKVEMLGQMVSARWEERNDRGFSSEDGRIIKMRTINSEQFSRVAHLMVRDGKRRITDAALSFMDERGLAVWYMDDGSADNRARGRLAAIRLHVYAYPEDDVDLLCAWFAARWGLVAKKRRKTNHGEFKGYYVELTGESARGFSRLVAPYVPRCMNYKLAHCDRRSYADWSEAAEHPAPVTVISAEPCELPESYSRIGFDLEVEGTHRYFAGGVLVSNSKFDVAFLQKSSGCERGYWIPPDAVAKLGDLARDADGGKADWSEPMCGLRLGDSMIADFLCDENPFAFGLKARVKELLGHEMTTYGDIMKTRKQGVLPFMADKVKPLGQYAMEDCYWTWCLFENRMRELNRQTPGEALPEDGVSMLGALPTGKVSPFDRTRMMGGLERLYWGIDMHITPLLTEMETTGVQIDWRWLREVTAQLEGKKDKIISRIEERIGWTINPNSSPQVAALLFTPKEHGGLGVPTKGIKRGKSGAISTGSKEIAHLSRVDPIVEDILDWRSADTIQSNFSVKLAKIAQEEGDRCYSHFKQTGTKIGRLSCISGSSKLSIRRGDEEYRRSTKISELLSFAGQDVRIVTHKGRERRITHLVNKGPGVMFDVETEDGATIRCTQEHRFYTERGWRALKDIRVGDRLLRAEVCEAQAASGRSPLGAGPSVVPADLRGGQARGAVEDPRLRAVERDRAGLQGGLRVGVSAPVPGQPDQAAESGRDPADVSDLRTVSQDQGLPAHGGVVQDRVCGQRSDAGGGEGEVRHLAPSDDSCGHALPAVFGIAQGEAGTTHQRETPERGTVLLAGGGGEGSRGWADRRGDRHEVQGRFGVGVDGSTASRDRPVAGQCLSVVGQPLAAGVGRAGASQPGDGNPDWKGGGGLPGHDRDVPTAHRAVGHPQAKLGNAQGAPSSERASPVSADVRRQPLRDAALACVDRSRDSAPTPGVFLQELAGGLRVAREEAAGRGRWRISPEVRDDAGARQAEGEEGEGAGLHRAAVHDRGGGPEAAHGRPQDRPGAWARVTFITPAGVETVWDLSVEGDESYVAHGFVNHNSADPINLQNQPRDRNLIRKAFCAYFEDDPDPDLLLYGCDYCVVEGTRVATDRGMVPIEDVQPGKDFAVLEDGSTAGITDLIERGELPVVELRTKMGYTLRATALHRIRVVDSGGGYVWRRIGEMRHTDRVAVQADCHRGRDVTPLPAIEFTHHHNRRETTVPPALTPDVAEFLGYLVGDGCVQPYYLGFVVCQKDEDVWEWALGRAAMFSLAPTVSTYRGVREAKFYSRPLVRWCKAVGVSKEHVPEALWSASRRAVCSFLRGLFEADGSIGGKSNGRRITVSGVSEEMMRQVQQLLLAVGIPTTRRAQKQKISDKPLWVLSVPAAYAAVFRERVGFVGKRKRDQLNAYLETAGTSASFGAFPNLQNKACELGITGEVRRLLNNTRSLGRPVSLAVARQVRDIDADTYKALELYRTVEHGTLFDVVTSIEPVGTARVYDLSVPGPTTYVSDGFVSHNSQIELRVAAHLSGDKGMIEVYRTGKPCMRGPDGGACERYQWWVCEAKLPDGSYCNHTWVPALWDAPKGSHVCPQCGVKEKTEHQSRCRHVDLHQRTAEDAGVPRNPLAKCLDGSTLVFARSGPRTIRAVVGDTGPGEHRPIDAVRLEDARGGWVEARSGITRHDRPTKIIVTRRAVVVVTEDHRVQVLGDYGSLDPATPGYKHELGRSLVEARRLEPGMRLPLARFAPKPDGFHDQSTPVTVRLNPFTDEVGSGTATLELDERWAYFAGMFVGDGSASGNACSIAHAAGDDGAARAWRDVVLGAVGDLGLEPRCNKRQNATTFGSRRVRRYLEALGLCEEVGSSGRRVLRVPEWVLRGGPRIVWSFLAGLFDTDGSVPLDGGRVKRIEAVKTKHPELAGQVAALLRWLGCPVSVDLIYNEKNDAHYYGVRVLSAGHATFASRCPVRHPAKRDRVQERAATVRRAAGEDGDEIIAVLDGGLRQVYDVHVENDDHLYNQGGLVQHNNLNFGNLYRIGAPRFCQYADLYDNKGEPRIEYAEEVIQAWFDAYPAIVPFHQATERKLRGNGWISRTITGRQRRLNKERWKNEYRAITQGIQFTVSGSAQDILKRAMIDIGRAKQMKIANSRPGERRLWAKLRFIVQVHDEIMLQGPTALKDEIIEMMTTKMEGAARLRVPLKTDVKCGRTWDDVH